MNKLSKKSATAVTIELQLYCSLLLAFIYVHLILLAASGFLQKEWTLCWTVSVGRTLGKD